MAYKKINLYNNDKTRGTHDDFFLTEYYKCLNDAYEANDYVQANFIKDELDLWYIEMFHIQYPEKRKYLLLKNQDTALGIDSEDDKASEEVAIELLLKQT